MTRPVARTPDEAIDVVARGIVYQIVANRMTFDLWDEWPLIGENDWQAIRQRILERAKADAPDPAVMLDAYDFLAALAKADQ